MSGLAKSANSPASSILEPILVAYENSNTKNLSDRNVELVQALKDGGFTVEKYPADKFPSLATVHTTIQESPPKATNATMNTEKAKDIANALRAFQTELVKAEEATTTGARRRRRGKTTKKSTKRRRYTRRR